MKVMEVIRIIGKLSFTLIFILSENKMAALPLTVFPIIMALFLWLREEAVISSTEATAKSQNDLVYAVGNMVSNYRLIADFYLRPFIVKSFEGNIDAFNEKLK